MVCWHRVSIPDRHLGWYFVHYSYFAGMVNHSNEFVIKAEIKIINTSKTPKRALLFSSRLSTCLEMYKREN
jgi:hypothetical protein